LVAKTMKSDPGYRSGGATAARDVITSRDNRWLKEFRVALRGGVPTSSGAVGVEGVRLVEEALTSGCRLEAVLFGESGERYRERLAPLIGRPEVGFPVLKTTDRLFEGIADTEHPQGLAALVVPRVWTLEELLGREIGDWHLASGEKRENGNSKFEAQEENAGLNAGAAGPACAALIVVLAGVQDPGNVGTILRTAAAFGATGAVTAATGQSGTASPFAPKALRASAGAALHMPMVSGMALGILLTQLKVKGIRTLASCVEQAREPRQISDIGYLERPALGMKPGGLSPSGAMPPWEVDWCEPVALLVGNEGLGLPEDIVRGADARVHIPMAGRVESLNAAAAAAVVLYEAFRQRKKKEV
jgi:RNA methyltransferase, TrmH family